jgi:hypothetical protein
MSTGLDRLRPDGSTIERHSTSLALDQALGYGTSAALGNTGRHCYDLTDCDDQADEELLRLAGRLVSAGRTGRQRTTCTVAQRARMSG